MISEALRKRLALDKFMHKCCYPECGKVPQWHHVWLYGGKQIDETWAVVPACPEHHNQATPHKNGYKQEVREYFEWVSLMRATPFDLAPYTKPLDSAWPNTIRHLSAEAKKNKWKICMEK